MKIAIYGAGAVGGLLAARLAQQENGHQLSLVARGRTLEAVREHGLRIEDSTGIRHIMIRADDTPSRIGVQDIVILAVKSTALADVATRIAPLLGPETCIVTAMNGVPWWFFEQPARPFSGLRLQSLDPDGLLARAMPVQKLIGCVVHLSSSAPEPGLIRPGFGNRLILGEALPSQSSRLSALVALLANAGFDAEASTDIHRDIWYKLWGNMTMNPLSAMTGASADKVLDDPLVRDFCLKAMAEAAAIGNRIGCHIEQSGEERMRLTRQLGAFKTSMLQDAEAGRALEIDALVGAVREIGLQVEVATPAIDALLGLVRLYARSHALYPQ
ncbi:2-dehydropantoate 2-reductase [Actimicrobium sp. CCI2.3]|uniref:2-dehydropantoate 2-reductase n=1 Tax=Actimicrobium sp. CCI2.3 TaxID=3048616 RepID=UPI002AB4D722|nr:2-dehydropantoate 2-reductase [Actimicrobium sp. CCI2.3]MDY7572717.1 2-dehydropantoate 2-reductase [Actimicrobium sp. CCI2.3]MEB0022236.1 2-dehydropantoate 2-reductase [Actimicrobium sp. CCI2.3]